MSTDVKPPTLNTDSLAEAARIVLALPNEMPPEVRQSAAELVETIAKDIKGALPETPPDTTARDLAIDSAIANTSAALARVLPPGEVLVKATTAVAQLGELVKAGAPATPTRGGRRTS